MAQIATMLLIPMCLGDRRAWQWSRPGADLQPRWRGAGWAAVVVLRIQILIIYGHAAWSKLVQDGWHNGTAEYVIVFDPHYGLSPPVRDAFLPLLTSPAVIAAATWGTIGLEVAIAVLALGTWRMRLTALGLAVILHGAIIALMAMPSFGLVMIALLTINAIDGTKPARHQPQPSALTPRGDTR